MVILPAEKQGGGDVHTLIICVISVAAMLVSKDIVHQDLKRLQIHAQEEECKKAALIAVNNYNKALVQ